MDASNVKNDLKLYADFEKANILQRFFKTGKGDYGEGDIFLGIVVPNTRKVAKKNSGLSLPEIKKLLYSKIHEDRLCALLILVKQFDSADEKYRKEIFNLYIKNSERVNNWDLVDLSAPRIVGKYLLERDRKLLYKLAKSENLWQRRISIISTFWFIREKQFEDTLKLAKILLNDKEDLIHKAVGWALREVGKKDVGMLVDFLKENYKMMPRTILRYAIEKFPEIERQRYLKGLI